MLFAVPCPLFVTHFLKVKSQTQAISQTQSKFSSYTPGILRQYKSIEFFFWHLQNYILIRPTHEYDELQEVLHLTVLSIQ